jgi:hypothetical protein
MTHILSKLMAVRIKMIEGLPKTEPGLRDRPFSKWHFALSILVGALFLWASYARWLLSGEFFAESGVVFFQQLEIQEDMIWYLLGHDSGYLSVPQRLIALLANFIQVPWQFVPYFYEILSALIVVVAIAAISLPQFRAVIPNDSARLVLSLSLQFVRSEDTTKIISFTYLLAPLLILIFLTMLLDRDRKPAWWFYLGPLLYLSKLSLISVTFPLLILCGVLSTRRYWPLLGLFVVALMANFSRVVYSLQMGIYRDLDVEVATNAVHLEDRLKTFAIAIIEHVYGMFSPALVAVVGRLDYSVLLVLLLGMIWAVVRLMRRHLSTHEAWLFLGGLCLIVGNVAVLALGLNSDQFGFFSDKVRNPAEIYRWNIVSIAGGMMCLLALVSGAVSARIKHPRGVVSIVYALVLLLGGWIPNLILIQHNSAGVSSWSQVAQAAERGDDFCTYVSPHPWNFGKACEPLALTGAGPVNEFSGVVIGTPAEKLTGPQSIIAIGANLRRTDPRAQEWTVSLYVDLVDGTTLERTVVLDWRSAGWNNFAVLFPLAQSVPIQNISTLRLITSEPVFARADDTGRMLLDVFGLPQ